MRLLILLVATLVACLPLAPSARGETNIGVLPMERGRGDAVERLLYEIISRLPGLTGIWAPTPSFDALLSAIRKAREDGRQIDTLIIGAHGNETALRSNSPSLGFADQDLVPGDVDLAGMRRERDRILERLLDVNREPNPKLCTRWRDLRDRLAALETAADAFAPGARVLLINCGAAGTREGERFVRDLGAIFLGRNGGVITASRIDVDLGEDSALNRARFWKYSGGRGQLYPVGPYFFAGDFVNFDIAPDTLPKRSFARELTGSLSVRVLDGETGQPIPGVSVTLSADGQSVVAGTAPANGGTRWRSARPRFSPGRT
jgi:hypothetical protein